MEIITIKSCLQPKDSSLLFIIMTHRIFYKMEVNSIGTTNDYLLRQKVGMLVNEIS